MDSSPPTEIIEQAVTDSPVSRLQRLVPVVRSLTGKVKTLSVVSAVSALVLWWLMFDPHEWLAGVTGPWLGIALVTLLVLLIPAGAAYVGYRTLQELLDLPSKLKGAVAESSTSAKDAIASRDLPKRGRLFGFFRAIWAARTLVLDSKGAFGKAAAAVRIARLASLPFVLGLLVTFALNFVVIAAAVTVAALSLLLRSP